MEGMNARQTLKQEPVLIGGISGGAVAALILQLLPPLFAALASYGISITPELKALIDIVVMVLVPIGFAFVARNYATWFSPDNPLVKYPDDPLVKWADDPTP